MTTEYGSAGPGRFSLFQKNGLIWSIQRQQVASVAHLAAGRALDIGCGEGPLLPLFEGRVERVIGIDRPGHRGDAHAGDVHGSALALPFREAAFDTALCFQVLEHVPEPEQLLREACRVLRPGGHLILTAPHIWNEHEMPHDYFRYTRYGLRHLFTKAGFEILEVRPMSGYFVTSAARFCYFLAHFERFHLKPLLAPMYFLVQSTAKLLDRIYCDTTESWNFLAVGRKPGGSETSAG